MRIGPIEIFRHDSANGLVYERDRLASELGELEGWLARWMVMHHCRSVRVATPMLVAPDARDANQREAVSRVLQAYARAREDDPKPSTVGSMWELVAERQSEFIGMLDSGDEVALGDILSRLMQSEVVWGISGQMPEMRQELLESPVRSTLQLMLTDELVSLGEAFGAARVSCYQQGPALDRRDLDVDLDALVVAIEDRTGLDLAFPEVGGAFGCRIAGRLVTLDSIRHAYTVSLLKRLGAASGSTIVEIGGGFGCLAELCHRADLGRLSVFDLPWVNALQGYFLIRALPPGSVRLYGEDEGAILIEPYWRFDQQPPRSVDFVVNTNSLPEVGSDTGRMYIEQIGRVLRGCFVSINQEGKLPVGTYGPQNCVRELIEESGLLLSVHRARTWLWEGYVEEVFVPANG